MGTLWKKDWVEVDNELLNFTQGEDPVLDNLLIPYDVFGSLAHVRGLFFAGLLSHDNAAKLIGGLKDIYQNWLSNKFELCDDDEDVHSALERELTLKLGDTGKMVHLGRSRNDQILTVMRLYMKDVLFLTVEKAQKLGHTLCKEGEKYCDTMMPGYTHMQRAMPSTVAFWYASIAEGIAEAIESAKALYDRLDSSPLGAGAGFGVPLPLNREYTARILGFSKVQINAAHIQNTRGRYESWMAGFFVDVTRDLEKMAWDLMIFSSAEVSFVSIPEEFCTGSSIMPQKKNPDVLELLRATPGIIASKKNEIETVISKLPSNYHRDFQLTKPPLMRAFSTTNTILEIATKIAGKLKWNKDNMLKACSLDIFATNRAVELSGSGIPFRDAYVQAAAELREGKTDKWPIDAGSIIKNLSHTGAPGNPGLREILNRIEKAGSWMEKTQKTLHQKWDELLNPDNLETQ